MLFALRRDVVFSGHPAIADGAAVDDANLGQPPGFVKLRESKRPRPLVLRANEGDCLQVRFHNLLVRGVPDDRTGAPEQYQGRVPAHMEDPDGKVYNEAGDGSTGRELVKATAVSNDLPHTRAASFHVNGLDAVPVLAAQCPLSTATRQWIRGIDGDNVGLNKATVNPATPQPLRSRLEQQGSHVYPGQSAIYRMAAFREGTYFAYSTGATVGGEGDGGQLGAGLFGAVNVQPRGARWTMTARDTPAVRSRVEPSWPCSTDAKSPLLRFKSSATSSMANTVRAARALRSRISTLARVLFEPLITPGEKCWWGRIPVRRLHGFASTMCRVAMGWRMQRRSVATLFDDRFASDAGNAPVSAETGFPMCLPRVAPPASDPLCPLKNRAPTPNEGRFTCGSVAFESTAPPHWPANPSLRCDPGLPAPLLVGDYVTFNGMLTEDAPGSGSFFHAAHAVHAMAGIYTSPGANPAYVFIEEALAGTLGEPYPGIDQEQTSRFRMVDFVTDPSRRVEVFLVDVAGSAETERRLTTLGPNAVAQVGRIRITLPAKANFLPMTREVRIRIEGHTSTKVAGGLDSGQYTAPIAEFIYP